MGSIIGVSVGSTSAANGSSISIGSGNQFVSKTITPIIYNNSAGSTLAISLIDVGGEIDSFVNPITAGTTVGITAGNTYGFSFDYDVSDRGIRTAQCLIWSNDATDNPYLFNINYTVLGPELNIHTITNGSTFAVSDGSTVSISPGTVGYAFSQEFIFRNNGERVLSILSATLASNISASFITTPIGQSIAVGATDSLIVQIEPTSSGIQTVDISITSDDASENPYNWTVSQFVVSVPEIVVKMVDMDKTYFITDGISLGISNAMEYSDRRTYQIDIYNIGSTNLILQTNQITGKYTNLSNFPKNGQKVYPSYGVESNLLKYSFTLSPSTDIGVQGFTCSFNNNDSNETPFVFMITSLITSGLISVGFTTTGSSGIIHVNDGDVVSASNSAVLDSPLVTVYVENSGVVPFTITNFIVTSDVSEIVDGISDGTTVDAGELITFGFYVDSTTSGLATAAVGIFTNVFYNNTFVFGIVNNANIVQPSIEVLYGVTTLVHGITFATPDLYIGGTNRLAFTIKNSNAAFDVLNISNITITGDVGSSIAVPSGSITVGTSRPLIYSIDTGSTGAKHQTVIISSDDPDYSTFSFTTTQNVLESPYPDVKIDLLTNGSFIDQTGGSTVGITDGHINERRTIIFRVTNTSSAASLYISDFTYSGSGYSIINGINSGFLKYGEYQDLVISVRGGTSKEVKAFSFTITSDDPNEASYIIFINSTFSGEYLVSQSIITNENNSVENKEKLLSPGFLIKEHEI